MIEQLPESLPKSYKQIISLIGYGKENAKTVAYISKIVGLSSKSVREIVSELVTKYELGIGASNQVGCSGYYFISNEEERNATVRNLKSRAYKILKRADVLARMPPAEQKELFL